jgi:hypothetical protein
MQKVRAASPDDAFIQAKMKQFGHRPDAPMAIGGKQHVALERSLANYVPQSAQAQSARQALNPVGASHALGQVAPAAKAPTLDLAQRSGNWLRGALGNAPNMPRGVAPAVQTAGKAVSDPKWMGGLLKTLPSLVRK